MLLYKNISIHARGERVEDVLKEAEGFDQLQTDEMADTGNTTSEHINGMPHMEQAEDGEVEDGEIEDNPVSDAGILAETMRTNDEMPPDQERYAPPPAVESNSQCVPEPSAVPGQDEGLKNLMMSWYYAGYYTGLYESRKHSDTAKSQDVEIEVSKP
ncbi:MAG: hypothetical protein Q9213_007565 [Squamulea squamosa]